MFLLKPCVCVCVWKQFISISVSFSESVSFISFFSSSRRINVHFGLCWFFISVCLMPPEFMCEIYEFSRCCYFQQNPSVWHSSQKLYVIEDLPVQCCWRLVAYSDKNENFLFLFRKFHISYKVLFMFLSVILPLEVWCVFENEFQCENKTKNKTRVASFHGGDINDIWISLFSVVLSLEILLCV